jgi:hypothetical protein
LSSSNPITVGPTKSASQVMKGRLSASGLKVTPVAEPAVGGAGVLPPIIASRNPGKLPQVSTKKSDPGARLPTDSSLKLESVSASAEFATTVGVQPDAARANFLAPAAEVHGADTPMQWEQQHKHQPGGVTSPNNKHTGQGQQRASERQELPSSSGGGGSSRDQQGQQHQDGDAASTLGWFLGDSKDRQLWRTYVLALLDITGWVG